MKRALPWIAALVGAAYLLSKMRAPSTPDDGMAIHEFGKIPVIHNGRIKPLDSIARTQLRVVSDTETFKDEKGRHHPAIRWLLDVMTDSLEKEGARKHKVYRIYHPQVLHGLGLAERDGFRYSIEEFGDRLTALGPQMKAAVDKQHAEKPLDEQDRELLKFQRRLQAFQVIASFQIPHLVPPAAGRSDWRTLPEALQDRSARDENASALVRILEAYAKGNAAEFNSETAAYLARVLVGRPADSKKASFESFFNRADVFNACAALYVAGLVLSFAALLGWAGPLNRSAFLLMSVVWVAHTLALVGRIYISGRPPVTNLYSSAIFIGWGAGLLGLVFERLFRIGVGNMVAGGAGFLTLLVAYFLAADGDTMEVLQAVLDTQFWLATHVTSITFGYAASYVAGLFGLIYVGMGLLSRGVTVEMRALLARMTYGTICFAMFFSFVGTVLGGLWADDSWGRFWGWDPKENGALMIVLWNALILHARWGGLVRERGLAVLAVFGNVVVSWSWFGVNELSVGLHSYGFTEGRAMWLAVFMISQVAAMLAGCLPRSFWKSPDAVREESPDAKKAC